MKFNIPNIVLFFFFFCSLSVIQAQPVNNYAKDVVMPAPNAAALGKYGDKLPSAQKAKYQRGVATYMARYFALQSRDYTVAKYEVGEAKVDANKDVLVDTKVYLLTGQVYNVAWRLVWRDGRYKVRDAKVLGFWLTNFQRSDFVSYLDKRNGDIGKLIKALYG